VRQRLASDRVGQDKVRHPAERLQECVDALSELAPEDWQRMSGDASGPPGLEKEALIAVARLDDEERRVLFSALDLGAYLSSEPSAELGKLQRWFGWRHESHADPVDPFVAHDRPVDS